jgi:hypothetical protein
MADYDYQPTSSLRLGAGFDPRDPTRVFPQKPSYTPIRVDTTGSGVVSATLSVRRIRSRQDIYDAMHVSASISGYSLFFSGSAGIDFDRQFSFESDSIVWAVSAYADYGRVEADKPKYPPDVQALIEGNDPDAAADVCGTEVALLERRAASVVAFFSLSSISEQEQTALATSLTVGVSGGTWGADMTASYKSFVAAAQQVSAISVSVYALGGTGISGLSGIVTSYGDLQGVSNILADYLKNYTFDTAAPIGYSTASLRSFGWKGQDPDMAVLNKRLVDLYFLYRDLDNTCTRLQTITSAAPDSPYDILLTPDDKAKFLELYKVYVRARDGVQEGALGCRHGVDTCPLAADLTPTQTIDWPHLPDPPVLNSVVGHTAPFSYGGVPGSQLPAFSSGYTASVSGAVTFDWRFVKPYNPDDPNDPELAAFWLNSKVDGWFTVGPMLNRNAPAAVAAIPFHIDWSPVIYTMFLPQINISHDDSPLYLQIIDVFGRKFFYLLYTPEISAGAKLRERPPDSMKR